MTVEKVGKYGRQVPHLVASSQSFHSVVCLISACHPAVGIYSEPLPLPGTCLGVSLFDAIIPSTYLIHSWHAAY